MEGLSLAYSTRLVRKHRSDRASKSDAKWSEKNFSMFWKHRPAYLTKPRSKLPLIYLNLLSVRFSCEQYQESQNLAVERNLFD